MERNQLITAFAQLGQVMLHLGENKEWPGFQIGLSEQEYNDLDLLLRSQQSFNGWFIESNVRSSLLALGQSLDFLQLSEWTSKYSYSDHPKRVGIIMAGNIPLVGFHDFLCVLLSGNIAVCKLSSDDKTLLPAMTNTLTKFLPDVKMRCEFVVGPIGKIDAVIATGSENSTKYFEQYFGKYPHVFRGNRTSIAVISGEESSEELRKLGEDIFQYFGLGCRNVSHLIIHESFLLDRFFEAIVDFGEVINHHKYANNYDYNRAVYLLNQHEILDNNFLLLKESDELFSPLSMIFYHRYQDVREIEKYLELHEEKIQCVVGKGYLPFGTAQCPQLNDYADGVDTMLFLNQL